MIEPDGFVLLTAHTPGFGPERLTQLIHDHLRTSRAATDAGDLAAVAADGRVLELGAFARTAGGA